ncbi:hypothetical protein GCM10009605_24190 [Nocardiopsis composta]
MPRIMHRPADSGAPARADPRRPRPGAHPAAEREATGRQRRDSGTGMDRPGEGAPELPAEQKGT